MRQRYGRATRRGFTIIEVIVIIVILGVLAAAVAPKLLSRIGQSKTAMAKSNAAVLATAMNSYIVDCGTPGSDATIAILWERPSGVDEGAWKGPYVENADALKDPWGKEWILKIPGEFNATFDITSLGADGQPGGTDENQDITNGKR
jgi:general secretion pathway protein G